MSEPTTDRVAGRQAALVVTITAEVAAAVGRGTPADAALAGLYRGHPEFGSRDRRLFSEAVFAWFRWRGWAAPHGGPVTARGAVLAWGLEAGDTAHPAIERLRAEAGLPAVPAALAAGAGLAERAAWFARWTGGALPRPEQVVPEWSAAVLATATPELGAFARLLESLQSRPPTWLRVRPGEQPAVEAALAAAGIGFTRHARLAGALAVPASSPLRALAPRLRGAAEVQDLASQAVGVVCAASPGSRWWDVCSGSGGKALHLAEQVGRTGAVLATEVRPGSLRELERRVREAGAAAVQPRAWDGAADPAPGREFDGVLVDAPCSGLGTWHRNPDARWRTPAGEIERCVRLQDTLLRLGADKVRRGGVLVYATCTLAAAENDEVADRFLTERADFTAEPFEHPLTGERTPGRLCIRPWDGPCNGMFVARLRRA